MISFEVVKLFFSDAFSDIILLSIDMAPFWVTVVLGYFLFEAFVAWRRARFLLVGQTHVLLEIKLPKEAPKSPLAMELFLNALHQTVGETTWYDRWVLGKTRAYFSLEIVSIEGQVKFFIWTRSFLKKFVETQVYSQYPTAEVYEVPDYTSQVPYAKMGSDWKLFGVEFKLSKPDPYPIKTYINYETDKDQFEEKKIDPITPMLEFLGGIGRGEHAWFQILVKANKGKKDKAFYWSDDWQDDAKKLVDEIIKKAKERSGPSLEGDEFGDHRFAVLSEGDRNAMKAIERTIGKLGFDCGIRGLYVARRDVFDPSNIAGLFGVMKQYSTLDLNGFQPRDYTDFDYNWQKYINIPPFNPSSRVPFISLKGLRVEYKKWNFFDAYQRRSWFFPPFERKPFVLNTEELATIYHFPGRVAETPTFERIESRKSEPPSNLPT